MSKNIVEPRTLPGFMELLPQEQIESEPQEHIKAFDYIINPTMAATGLFLFIFFLVKYIQNTTIADKGWAYKYSSNQDFIFLLFTGILLFLIFGICAIKTFKNKQDNRLTTISLIVIAGFQIWSLPKAMASKDSKLSMPS